MSGPYRVLVTGSREFTDYGAIRKELGNLVGNGVGNCDSHRVVVVHGAARGADELADRAAKALGMSTEPHPADWSRGRGAGCARNAEMVRLGADVCMAFYQPGAGNRGTDHCARTAEAAGIPVRRITASRECPAAVTP